jgi:hypothetical protein
MGVRASVRLSPLEGVPNSSIAVAPNNGMHLGGLGGLGATHQQALSIRAGESFAAVSRCDRWRFPASVTFAVPSSRSVGVEGSFAPVTHQDQGSTGR